MGGGNGAGRGNAAKEKGEEHVLAIECTVNCEDSGIFHLLVV
jgi:hypothetical protein